MGLDSQQAEILADLRWRLTTAKRQKSRVISKLKVVENDMVFDRRNHSDNDVFFGDASDSGKIRAFQKLQSFFPDVELKKIEDIERFHQ